MTTLVVPSGLLRHEKVWNYDRKELDCGRGVSLDVKYGSVLRLVHVKRTLVFPLPASQSNIVSLQ